MEALFFWCAVLVYALASGGHIYALVFRNERILPRLFPVIAGGFLLHTAAIAARYHAQGHLPWSGDYENGLAGGWFIVLFTLYASRQKKELQPLGAATLPLVLLIMGYGAMRNPAVSPMAASLKSVWLYVHVYFAMISFGAYALAMGTGVIFLVRKKSLANGDPDPALTRVPSLERLDELMFRFVVFGFITDAITIAAGAVWAKDLWGSYWSWDPVETWSLISWLIYGIAIHLRVTMGWRGSRLAWLVIMALSTVIITYFGVTFVVESSLHIFNVR